MESTKDFAKFIQSKLDADPTLKGEVETDLAAIRLARFPTRSTAHMDQFERADGITQMIADLDQLAKADGCIAAAWAAEFVRTISDKLSHVLANPDIDYGRLLDWLNDSRREGLRENFKAK